MPAVEYPDLFLAICDFTMHTCEQEFSFERSGWQGQNKELVAIWGIDKRANPVAFAELQAKYTAGGINARAEIEEAARDFYYRYYWLPVVNPAQVGVMQQFAFDTAVNNGPYYGREIGTQRFDNLEQAALYRIQRYVDVARHHESKKKFLFGWLNRIFAVLAFLKGNHDRTPNHHGAV